MEQLVARWSHTPKVAGSNPAPATKSNNCTALIGGATMNNEQLFAWLVKQWDTNTDPEDFDTLLSLAGPLATTLQTKMLASIYEANEKRVPLA